MGTFARPSQRSKNSKYQSSNAKHNGTRGGHSAFVNGSQASLNNSSAHINSSRQKKHQQSNQTGGNNNNIQSFVDITDQDVGEDKSFLSRKKNNCVAKAMAVNMDYTGGALGNETDQTVNASETKNKIVAPVIESSAQFTDMAAHTPMRQIGVFSSDSRKQPASQST